MARTFVLPGRLMYLRPLKSKPKEKKARRKYDAVWSNAKVTRCLCNTRLACKPGGGGFSRFWPLSNRTVMNVAVAGPPRRGDHRESEDDG